MELPPTPPRRGAWHCLVMPGRPSVLRGEHRLPAVGRLGRLRPALPGLGPERTQRSGAGTEEQPGQPRVWSENRPKLGNHGFKKKKKKLL